MFIIVTIPDPKWALQMLEISAKVGTIDDFSTHRPEIRRSTLSFRPLFLAISLFLRGLFIASNPKIYLETLTGT